MLWVGWIRAGYRLVNIALHTANTFLVFQLLRRLTRSFACAGRQRPNLRSLFPWPRPCCF